MHIIVVQMRRFSLVLNTIDILCLIYSYFGLNEIFKKT